MATFLAALILALIASSILQTLAMAAHGQGGHHYDNKNQYGPGSLELPMPLTMLEDVQPDPVPQAMHVLLSEVLRKVPVRASGVLWEQRRVPLLQQLEDQGRWTKVPLSFLPSPKPMFHFTYNIVLCSN